MEKELIIDLLQKSYKKLKSSVFFDKTQLVLRDKIVENESCSDEFAFNSTSLSIENSIEQLAEWIIKSEWDSIYNSITESIDILSFPKKFNDANTDKTLLSNIQILDTDVTEAQYFIDMNVEGYILGVAWLLIIGYHFDQDLYEHSYGNRLRPNLLNEDQKPTFSPYLFSPYFHQYENWRDVALENAKKSIQKNQNAVLFTMDLRRFFYQVNISEEHLLDLTDKFCKNGPICHEYSDLIRPLTKFIWKVIEKYSAILREEEYELVESRNILPIGFLPSNVLANYCLKKFDDILVKGWNPLYYGRYVDDIIIVDKIENNSPIAEKARKGELTSEYIIRHYLLQCDAWRRNYDEEHGILIKNGDSTYAINPEFIDFKGSEIIIQNNKFKIFYFDSHQSDVLLQNFKKVLYENKSEFRFLPEDESIFQHDDYSDIYILKEQEGPNKLRGVEGIYVDKFSLSKFLGKYMRVSGLIDDKKESQFDKDIEKIFTPRVILENYTTWEKVLEILIINKRLDAATSFILKVVDSIIHIKYNNDNDNNKKIQHSLFSVLLSSINKVYSLVWGPDIQEQLNCLFDGIMQICNLNECENFIRYFCRDHILNMRKKYCETRMSDKYAMPLAIDGFLQNGKCILSDDNSINLTNLKSYTSNLYSYDCLDPNTQPYRYYPYLVTMNDLTIHNELKMLYKPHSNRSKNYVYDLKENYIKLNYIESTEEKISSIPVDFKHFSNKNIATRDNNMAIKVSTNRKNKFKIAVANTMLYDSDFENVLRDSPNRKYKRYCELVKMVNEAIKNNVDILVMPEGYVPFEWLPILSRTCAKNQMAIVTGVEHLKLKISTGENNVYNLTAVILPYVEEDYKFAYIHFHPKKYFAPHEKTAIDSYRCNAIEGNEYQLFCWNDLWFPVYCCYELTSITDRALFQSYADAVIAVEWNKDTNYYSSIMESLSRDLHCYCIQVNTSKYGDSRIIQPTKTEEKDILNVKGGITSTILIDNIDVEALRNFQLKGNLLQMSSHKGIPFKPTPPNFEYDILQDKINGTLWKNIDKSVCDDKESNQNSIAFTKR